MPAYDYCCQGCGQRFEKTQRITEAAGATCPSCGEVRCERLITGGTFHLKGSGWYASDYAAKKAAAPVDKPAETPPVATCAKPETSTAACPAVAAADN